MMSSVIHIHLILKFMYVHALAFFKCVVLFCTIPTLLDYQHSFFIRNQFIRNKISGGKRFKKLESWDKGNLRNLVYIRFHEIQEITRFILYKKAY